MAKTVVLDNEFATVWFHTDTKIVHHEIHKFVFGKALRDVLNTGADLLKRNHAYKYLSDDRKNGALKTDDAEWGKADWFPRAVKSGWTHWAVVMPQTVIGQMNLKKFIAQYAEAGVTVEVFSDPDEALEWLADQ